VEQHGVNSLGANVIKLFFSPISKVTKRLGQNHPIFWRVAKTVAKWKNANIYAEAQFESPKHQTTLETLKNTHNKLCFETAHLRENVKKLFKQKVAQNVTISLAYFIFTKNHIKLPKEA
jgi:hypothetical protein